MELTRFDAVVLVGMTLGVIFMSFTFPALGMTDNDAVNETDVPEFNMSADRFDFAGDFPDNPGAPSQGTLEWVNDDADISDNTRWIEGDDTSDGTQITLVNFNKSGSAEINITVADYSSGSSVRDEYQITKEGEFITHNNFSYQIEFEVTDYEPSGNASASVRYTIEEQPDDTGWLGRIPVVGGLFSAGSQLASIVGWIGSIIWWFVTYLFEIAATLVVVLFEAIAFIFSLFHWLLSTYFGIVSAASAPWSAFLVIPGVVLFIEFAKIGMIGVSLLPTT